MFPLELTLEIFSYLEPPELIYLKIEFPFIKNEITRILENIHKQGCNFILLQGKRKGQRCGITALERNKENIQGMVIPDCGRAIHPRHIYNRCMDHQPYYDDGEKRCEHVMGKNARFPGEKCGNKPMFGVDYCYRCCKNVKQLNGFTSLSREKLYESFREERKRQPPRRPGRNGSIFKTGRPLGQSYISEA